MYVVTYKVTTKNLQTGGVTLVSYKERLLATIDEVYALKCELVKDDTVSSIRLMVEIQ